MKVLSLTPINHIPGIREKLFDFGEVRFAPTADRKHALKAILEFQPDAIFVNPNKQTYKIDREFLSKGIKIVATASTGTNHIDIDCCKELGITVVSLTTDSHTIEKISSTAEHAFALTLSLIRNIPSSFEHVKNGEWNYEPFVGRQLDKLTVGVVGMGRLGRMYARYCTPFFGALRVCDPYRHLGAWSSYERTLEQIIQECDVVALHVHLNEETKGMINDALLFKAKKEGIYLINTSRGEVVDESSIIHALADKRLKGYATDVVADELGSIEKSPIVKACDLGLNIIITPHIGGMTIDAQQIAYGRVLDKLKELK